jgi:DNA-binding PadR family transcriptional regulator
MATSEQLDRNPGIAPELTAFQLKILFVLAEEPRYGLAVKRELQTYYDEEVNHGRLYPNLNELIGLGLVEKNELDKRTNEYSLTDDGFQTLYGELDWMFAKLSSGSEGADGLAMLVSRYT